MKISINNLTMKEVAKIASKMGWSEVALTTDRGFAYLEQDSNPVAIGLAARGNKPVGIEAIIGESIDRIVF